MLMQRFFKQIRKRNNNLSNSKEKRKIPEHVKTKRVSLEKINLSPKYNKIKEYAIKEARFMQAKQIDKERKTRENIVIILICYNNRI